MDRLEASYAALESILIESGRGAGLSTGHELDLLDLSSFKMLSVNQALCLARVRTERMKFHRSNTVVHEDLAFWIEETDDLIRQLNRKTHSTSKYASAGVATRQSFLFLAPQAHPDCATGLPYLRLVRPSAADEVSWDLLPVLLSAA